MSWSCNDSFGDTDSVVRSGARWVACVRRWGKRMVLVAGLLVAMLVGIGGEGKVSAETNPNGCNAGDEVTIQHGQSGSSEMGTIVTKPDSEAIWGNNYTLAVGCTEDGKYFIRHVGIAGDEDKYYTGDSPSVPKMTVEEINTGDYIDGEGTGTTWVRVEGVDYGFTMTKVVQGEDTADSETGMADNVYDPTQSDEENAAEGRAEKVDDTLDVIDHDDECRKYSGTLSWLICPITSGAAGVGQWMWGIIEKDFLKIDSKSFFANGGGVESAWKIFRDIANIIFIILFMVVIFSQLTGIGIDNYGIKKILPKLIVVAILINLSYVICVLAVDLSNILGVSLNGLFSGIATTVGESAQVAEKVGFTPGQSLAAIGLGVGATAATGGVFILFVILSGGPLVAFAAIGFAVLGIVITIVTSIIFMFLILMIRNAGVVILITIAPVAIVCYMLPNTEKFSKRWVDLMKALLLVYPICGAMIGAGKLAGILLASVGTEAMAVAGMIVEVLPFFLIPMLLKKSLALMGNIGAKLSSVGKTTGRGLSSKAQGAIQGTQKFKDWSKFNQDKTIAGRANRIQRRLEAKKARNGGLSAWENERLLKSTETLNAYNQRGAQGEEGEMLIDKETMKQKIAAQKSNTLEKMYADNYAKMTNRDDIKNAFISSLSGKNREDTVAAMNALIQKGGTTEALNALEGADWTNMDSGVRDYLIQAMGASNVDAMKAYSKYRQSGGKASFQEWSDGTGATIAAEASDANIKAKTYAQHLMEGGENSMTSYSKDEVQFVQGKVNEIRTVMENQAVAAGKDASVGKSNFGTMLKNIALKSNDARAQTVAESTMAGQLASGGIDVDHLKITSEDIGNMRGETAAAIQDGVARNLVGDAAWIGGNDTFRDMQRKEAAKKLRSTDAGVGLGNQIAGAKTDPRIANRMNASTRRVFVDPLP